MTKKKNKKFKGRILPKTNIAVKEYLLIQKQNISDNELQEQKKSNNESEEK